MHCTIKLTEETCRNFKGEIWISQPLFTMQIKAIDMLEQLTEKNH